MLRAFWVGIGAQGFQVQSQRNKLLRIQASGLVFERRARVSARLAPPRRWCAYVFLCLVVLCLDSVCVRRCAAGDVVTGGCVF